jgi:hypothetical protein
MKRRIAFSRPCTSLGFPSMSRQTMKTTRNRSTTTARMLSLGDLVEICDSAGFCGVLAVFVLSGAAPLTH